MPDAGRAGPRATMRLSEAGWSPTKAGMRRSASGSEQEHRASVKVPRNDFETPRKTASFNSALPIEQRGRGVKTGWDIRLDPPPGRWTPPKKIRFVPRGERGRCGRVLAVGENSICLQTFSRYSPSTVYCSRRRGLTERSAADERPGRPVVPPLLESYEHAAEAFFSSTFIHRHGCWDPRERDFRGLVLIERRGRAGLGAAGRECAKAHLEGRVGPAVDPGDVHARVASHTGTVLPGGATLHDACATEYNEDNEPAVVTFSEPGGGDPAVAPGLKEVLLASARGHQGPAALERSTRAGRNGLRCGGWGPGCWERRLRGREGRRADVHAAHDGWSGAGPEASSGPMVPKRKVRATPSTEPSEYVSIHLEG